MEGGFGNGRGPLIPKREEHMIYPEEEEIPLEDELFQEISEVPAQKSCSKFETILKKGSKPPSK